MTGHVHAKLMLEYAHDAAETDEPWKLWQSRNPSEGPEWRQLSGGHPGWTPHREYRRKPTTITINGVEVEPPMKAAPAWGTRYWVISLSAVDGCFSDIWQDTHTDRRALARGLAFRSSEEAKAFKAALCLPMDAALKP